MVILILGGTGEARALAARLVALGHDVTTSLAGVTSSPVLPEGKLRVGGFGGVEGLRLHLAETRPDAVIDATHPFAAQMSKHAYAACSQSGMRLLRLERREWTTQEGDSWISVLSMADAAMALPEGARVLVTTGRKGLEPLLVRADLAGVIRVVEPLAETLPAHWKMMLDRPPYAVEQELALLQREAITHVLSKNAGGDSTAAKLHAARLLSLPVVMLRRPIKPECPTFASVEDVVALLGSGGIGG